MSAVGTVPALPLDHLAAVDLVALNERAALLTRVDRKYLLSRDDAAAVLAALPPGAQVLEMAGLRRFGYESVYFDTPDLDCYARAAHRRRRRFKVRTRTYLDSDECWLEVKTRGSRGTTVKRRQPYELAHRDTLTVAGRRFVHDMLAEAGIEAAPAADLFPVLTTRYRRTTVHLPGSGARATVDTDLTWSAGEGLHRDVPGLVILETKAAASPCVVDRLLWEGGHRPTAVSKYATGLASLHPGLPANRWHRTLQRLHDTPVA